MKVEDPRDGKDQAREHGGAEKHRNEVIKEGEIGALHRGRNAANRGLLGDRQLRQWYGGFGGKRNAQWRNVR